MVWLLPSHPSEAARCASTEDHQAPSPLRFREQEDDQAAFPIIFIVLSPYANIHSLCREGLFALAPRLSILTRRF